MSFHLQPHHIEIGEEVAARAAENGGLAPVDLKRFWEEQAIARRTLWETEDCPQFPLGIGMSHECVFAELGLEENWWELAHNPRYKANLAKQYNDLSEQIVGRRLLSETVPDPVKSWPPVKALHDIFEADNVWHN